MTFPKEFYGTQAKSQRSYTDVPNDDMDLDRAINSDPNCFVEMAASTEPKPLKILLSPFNARNWSPEKLASVLNRLKEMMDQGFEIFAWQSQPPASETIKPLTKENLQDLASPELRKGMNPRNYEAMVAAACKQIPQTTCDDLFVLDDHWIDRLIHPEKKDPSKKRSIAVSDFEYIAEQWNSPLAVDLLAFFNTCKPKITDFLVDEISHQAVRVIYALLNRCGKDVSTVLANFLTNPSCLRRCLDLSFDAPNIKVEAMQINFLKNYSAFSLEHIIKIRIRFLEVDDSMDPASHTAAFKEDFYDRIMSSGIHISAEDLKTLVERCQADLEEIDLSGCKKIENAFVNLPKGALPKLKKFTAKHCSLNKNDICDLLIASPCLKEINLSGCRNIKDFVADIANKSGYDTIFPELRKIDLSYTTLGLLDVCLLNQFTHNLEEINVFGLILKEDHFPQPEPHFWHNLFQCKPALRLTISPPEKHENPQVVKEAEITAKSRLESKHSPTKSTANQRQTCDADTHYNPNKRHEVNRIFYALTGNNHPDVNYYRLACFDTLELNPNPCNVSNAFFLFNKNQDLQFGENKDLDAFKKQGLSTFQSKGRQSFDLDEKWQSVASLSAHEVMQDFKATPPDAAVEIAYSKRDNLYYIRSKKGRQRVDLDFTLEVLQTQPFLPQGEKEFKIKALVDKILDYGVGALDLCPEKPSQKRIGKDYLLAILEQGRGACRHRAVAFKARMDENYSDVPTRILVNDCHAWAEIYLNGHWILCDFGGYEEQLEIKENLAVNAPSESKSEAKHESKNDNNPYLKTLQTWETKPEESNEPINPQAYCKELLAPDGQMNKRWIKLGSDEAVDAMAIRLQRQCNSTQRPLFYIDSPADVFCSKRFLEQKENLGRLRKGPGGPLHDFLKAEYKKDNPPVILINYRNFSKKQIIGLHGWLDPERVADGTPIPTDALIVAVGNIYSKEAYTDTDLSSRFDIKDERLLTNDALPDFVPPLPIQDKTNETCKAIINLFHGSNWKSQLLGRWTMTEHGLSFEEGRLLAALGEGGPVEIQNGPWDDPEFNAFMHQACWVGKLRHLGKIYNTEGLSVLKSEGYDWATLKERIRIYSKSQSYETEDLLLNPSQLSQFFARFKYQEESRTLIKKDGHLKKAAKKEKKHLSVYLTRSLSEDAWARLLSACKAEDLYLQLKLAPGVSLPQMVLTEDGILPVKEPLECKSATLDDYRKIIQSPEPEAKIAEIKAKDSTSQWIVMDVSELRPSDLFIKTTPIKEKVKTDTLEEEKEEQEQKEVPLQFDQREMALLTALKEKMNIILTGSISNALADALAPLLLERQNLDSPKPGKLMVVAKDTQRLQYAPQCSFGEEVSFTRIPFREVSSALQQLNFNKSDLGEWNKEILRNSQKETQDFFDNRNQALHDILFHPTSPNHCIYIAGLSGVGKSTFIDEELQKPHKLFKGEGGMTDWTTYHPKDPHSKEPIYLFIDEANLSPRLWTELEGLYLNEPPTIVVDGTLRTLTPQHKIIFAGNPLNYGDERSLAPFFTRHVPVIEFKPLPYCVLFEKSLKPVFENTGISSLEQEALCQHFFDIYAFLCEQSAADVLISPRELETMALLTVSYCKQMEKEGVVLSEAQRGEVARHYAYKYAEALVPEDKRVHFEEIFGKTIPTIKPLPLPIEEINKNPHFRVTYSRLEVLNSLHELLMLRDARQQSSTNDKQQFGGLGGILLQGESSVGKTTMVTALLVAHQFKEEHDYNKPSQKAKPFYRLDSNRSLEEREKLAIKACYEGAVLVVDEFNTLTSMQRLLNDLMMGKIPKKYQILDKKAKPGFLVIGTQNPPSMAGRSLMCTAQARRWHKMEVGGYSSKELLEIIVGDQDYSQEKEKLAEFEMAVTAFETNLALAKKEHHSPAPTLRDLFRITDAIKGRSVKKPRLLEEPSTLQPQQKQSPNPELRPKSKPKHSNYYFALRVLEAVALAGPIALIVTSFVFSLGLIAPIAGSALGGTILLVELGMFCKKKCNSPRHRERSEGSPEFITELK